MGLVVVARQMTFFGRRVYVQFNEWMVFMEWWWDDGDAFQCVRFVGHTTDVVRLDRALRFLSMWQQE